MAERLEVYIKTKERELSKREKDNIRIRITSEKAKGIVDAYTLAKEFNCVPTQITGIEAAMNRGKGRKKR